LHGVQVRQSCEKPKMQLKFSCMKQVLKGNYHTCS